MGWCKWTVGVKHLDTRAFEVRPAEIHTRVVQRSDVDIFKRLRLDIATDFADEESA